MVQLRRRLRVVDFSVLSGVASIVTATCGGIAYIILAIGQSRESARKKSNNRDDNFKQAERLESEARRLRRIAMQSSDDDSDPDGGGATYQLFEVRVAT